MEKKLTPNTSYYLNGENHPNIIVISEYELKTLPNEEQKKYKWWYTTGNQENTDAANRFSEDLKSIRDKFKAYWYQSLIDKLRT